MRYLLPCDQCGETMAIDASQAGRQIVCQCGAVLVVPSFRAIRALETVGEQPAAPRRRSWNPVRGATFALGLVTILVGLLLAAAAGLAWWQTDATEQSFGNPRQAAAEMAEFGPDKVWDIWGEMRDQGLGPYVPPQHIWAQQWIDRCRWAVMIGLLIVAAGVALSAGPIVVSKIRRA